MQITFESAYEWLYPDLPGHGTDKWPAMATARGASASFQILVKGLAQGDKITLSLTGAQADLFRELPVCANMNTGVTGYTVPEGEEPPYVTRKAPFRVYDALEDVKDGVTASGDTEAFYITLRTPGDAVPGEYPLSLSIAVNGAEQKYGTSLTVTNALVDRETFQMTQWFSIGNMAKFHGLEMWSEEHWDMIRRYGLLMRRMRQTHFWITWDLVGVTREGNTYSFDFSRVERLIRLYLSLGFTAIEGGTLCSRRQWISSEFWVNRALPYTMPALCDEGYLYLSQFLTAWREFLKSNGWYDRLVQHIGDEPCDRAAPEYRQVASIVRKFLPGVKIIEAVETLLLSGAVDVWVPKNEFLQKHIDELRPHQKLGDELWFYTCCNPGGYYANRLLDMPLIRTRMLFWGAYAFNVQGYLHWGLNHFMEGCDAYQQTATRNGDIGNCLPAGDRNIVYYSPDRKDVYGCVRLEQTMAGIEELELLRALERKDPAKAKEICGRVFRAFDDCDAAPGEFEAARRELLSAF